MRRCRHGFLELRRWMVPLLLIIAGAAPLTAQAPTEGIRWVPKLEQALAEASAEKQFVIIDVSAEWCPACREMESKTYSDPTFVEFTRNNVFMRVDEEKTEEGRRLTERFRIFTFPTFIVLSADGQEIDRLAGFWSRDRLIADLQSVMADPAAFGRLLEREKSEKLSPAAALRLLRANYDRQDYAECLKRLSAFSEALHEWPSPLASDWYFLSAMIYFQTQQYQPAVASCDRFLAANPKDRRAAEVMLAKGRALLGLKRLQEAARVLADLMDSFLGTPAADRARNVLSQIPEAYHTAAQGYRAALRKASRLVEEGKFTEALRQANQALQAAPLNAQPHLQLARIYLKMADKTADPIEKNGLTEKGLAKLRVSRRLEPDNNRSYSEAKRVLARQIMAHTSSRDREAEKAYEKAVFLLNQGSVEEAAAQVREALRLDANFSKAALLLGDILFLQTKYEQALESYRRAVQIAPLDPVNLRSIALVYRRQGQSRKAFEALLQSLAADPEYPQAWEDLCEMGKGMRFPLRRHADLVPYELLEISEGQSIEAPRLYVRVRAQTVPAWKEYARVRQLWRQNKFTETHPGETVYRLTAAEEQEALSALVAKWRALRQQNSSLRDDGLDFLEAIDRDRMMDAFVFIERYSEEFRSEYEQWKQKEKQKVGAYVTQRLFRPPEPSEYATAADSGTAPALAASKSGNQVQTSVLPGTTQTGSEKGVRAGRPVMILYSQAVAAHRSNDLDKAASLYEAALAVDPEFTPAHQNLAVIYFNRGNLLQAADHAEKGLEQSPESPSLLYLATQSYIQLQLFDRAVLILRRTSESPMQPQERANLLDRLAYVYIQMQEWDKVEKYLKEASGLDPENAEIAQHMELLQRMKASPAKDKP